MSNLEKIYNYAKEILKDDTSGHDINHINRCLKTADELLAKYPYANVFVVYTSIIVHDLIDHKLFDNPNQELEKLTIFLESLNVEDIDVIINIITNMSYSLNKPDYFKDNIEGMIVQDCDRIDALGSVGIIRTISYGINKKRDVSESLKHFDEKLFKLPNLMNLEYSKEIANERVKVMRMFYDCYFDEESIHIKHL